LFYFLLSLWRFFALCLVSPLHLSSFPHFVY
jgi:hypothetical protein